MRREGREAKAGQQRLCSLAILPARCRNGTCTLRLGVSIERCPSMGNVDRCQNMVKVAGSGRLGMRLVMWSQRIHIIGPTFFGGTGGE